VGPNRVIVVGASAGGVAALLGIAEALPAELPAALLVVMHVGAQRSVLPQLMAHRCALPVAHAQHGEPLHAGLVRVAPPDHHLLVVDGGLALSRGPKENFARPAIDPLFRSAALACGPATVGVVLTGGLDDGTAGLQAIKRCGGVAVVQDPDDAFEPSMPTSALQHVQVDHCLPLASIAPLLVSLAAQPVAPPRRAVPIEQMQHEHALMLAQGEPMEHLAAIGTATPFACPECHGGLWEVNDSRPARYRCHTGHAFTEQSLDHAFAVAGDEAGWNALRALQERQMFVEQLAARRHSEGRHDEAARLEAAAQKFREQASVLRQTLETLPGQISTST
jgi:two-component system, chemotaxis family, protein-glutamate methylesterase/glutaminase